VENIEMINEERSVSVVTNGIKYSMSINEKSRNGIMKGWWRKWRRRKCQYWYWNISISIDNVNIFEKTMLINDGNLSKKKKKRNEEEERSESEEMNGEKPIKEMKANLA